jgi:hypothetical protein
VSRAGGPRPPKLRAGETWSYVVWELRAPFPRCDAGFGHVGTQTCDGHYEPNNPPNPGFGGWGFNGDHNGTTKSTRKEGEDLITVNFYTPGAEILGRIPSEGSDRYTITSSQGPRGWRIESPDQSPDYAQTPAGRQGGPLQFRAVRTSVGSVYYFKASGWVVVAQKARPRPPKLRAGQSWSYVVWKLHAHSADEFTQVCNEEFGVTGTQTCDGHYDSAPFPKPEFGGWGFNGGHDGTSKATHPRDTKAMTIDFFTPGAEIDGGIPDESSDRYTVADSQGPGRWKIRSPSESPEYNQIAPGKLGGPLHIKVTAISGLHIGYDLEVYGYVVVERPAGHRRHGLSPLMRAMGF